MAPPMAKSDPAAAVEDRLSDSLSTGKPVDVTAEGAYTFTTAAIKIDLLQAMFESITVNPGLTCEPSQKRLRNFAFEHTERGYRVVLPTNLERYADSIALKCVIAACRLLDAEIIPGEELPEFKCMEGYSEYFHGIAAALKQGATGISEDRTSGMFHQGFRWVCAQALSKDKNKEIFKLDWLTPWKALQNKLAWFGNAPDYQKAWYNLVKEAAKFVRISSKRNFVQSFEELKKKMIHKFSWEAGSVFSPAEILAMQHFIADKHAAYQEYLGRVRDNIEEFLEGSFKTEYDRRSLEVRQYDKLVAGIASARAKCIFAKAHIGRKQKNAPKSREAWIAELTLAERIRATNPTGLFGDTRVEPHFLNVRYDLGVAEQWLKQVERLRAYQRSNPLLENWINGINLECIQLQDDAN